MLLCVLRSVVALLLLRLCVLGLLGSGSWWSVKHIFDRKVSLRLFFFGGCLISGLWRLLLLQFVFRWILFFVRPRPFFYLRWEILIWIQLQVSLVCFRQVLNELNHWLQCLKVIVILSVEKGFLTEVAHIRQVGLEHVSWTTSINFELFELEQRVDWTREEKISAVGSAIAWRFLKHHGDDFAEVEHVVKLALWCLELVHVAELYASLLDSLLNQSAFIDL